MNASPRTSLLMLFLAACGGSGDGSGGGRASAPLKPEVRDSAGVTIYEHPADALAKAPLLTLDSTPLAVFAGDVDDPDKDVSALMWPLFLGSGDLIGYDRQAKQILVLNTASGTRARYARAGSGPMEIGFPGRFVLLQGDSILYTDSQNDRVVIVHPDSGIVREFSRQTAEGLSRSGAHGRLSNDSVYLLTVPGAREPDAIGRVNHARRLGIWRIGEDSVRGLFTVPTGWLVYVAFDDGRGRAAYGLAFSPRTSIGMWNDGFLVARGEQWTIERWDTSGRLTTELRIKGPGIPVDEATFERFVQADVDEMAENFGSSGRAVDRDSIAASVRDRGHADTLAAYGSVSVSPNGTMWVTDFEMPGDTGWAATAIAPDGRILGRIVEPNGKPPITWGDDRVAIKTEDDLGIATITIRKVLGLR